MKRAAKISALAIVVVAIVVACLFAGVFTRQKAEPQAPGGITMGVRYILHREEIPVLDFENVSLNHAVAFFNRELSERPAVSHLRLVVWTSAQPPPAFHALADPPPLADEPDSPGLTVRASNISLYEAILHVSTMSGRVTRMIGDTLYLLPMGGYGQMEERTLTLDPTSRLARLHDAEAVKSALREQDRMVFFADSEVRFIGRNRVLVRNLDSQMGPGRFDPTMAERFREFAWPIWNSIVRPFGGRPREVSVVRPEPDLE